MDAKTPPSASNPLPTIHYPSPPFHHHHRHRQIPRMRQAQGDIHHSHPRSQRRRPPRQHQAWLSALRPSHLKLLPAHAVADPGSQSLRSRLLCCKPRRKALSEPLLRHAVGNLARRVHPRQKAIAKTLNTSRNPHNLRQIRSHTQDHRRTLVPPSSHLGVMTYVLFVLLNSSATRSTLR